MYKSGIDTALEGLHPRLPPVMEFQLIKFSLLPVGAKHPLLLVSTIWKSRMYLVCLQSAQSSRQLAGTPPQQNDFEVFMWSCPSTKDEQ
ncbi:hypothetical protein ElyMa_000603100 [Elysia marginata]|uniref:Uncharacterized protein n=1 Tax=Elysia marginata TaxID=1093978 RepID=A0AAV4G6M9_9GAST|nr:hypothetical protein ElyMa_000603100 [Elysia marginata]